MGAFPSSRSSSASSPAAVALEAKPQRLRHLLKRRQEKRGERLEAARKVMQAEPVAVPVVGPVVPGLGLGMAGG